LRNHHEARLLPGDDRETLRELLIALRKGQMAMFAIDRWVMGPSDAWPLFGEPARLPTAPFALAARSDAPVFLLVPWRMGANHFGGAVELITPERMPPEDSAASGAEGAHGQRGRDREAAIAQMRERLYPLLERYISAHPEGWVSALSPIWEFAEGAQLAQQERLATSESRAEHVERGEEAMREHVSAQRASAQTAPGENG
jgi:lauroyl/myristoyl acyltransferase